VESATQPVAHERDLNSLSLLTVSVVLATVTMTFGALITVFVVRSEGRIWWGTLQVPRVLWATTALLIASSVILEGARRKLQANDQRAFFRRMLWTTALGVLFLAGQIDAWFAVMHSGIVLAHNAHSWFVFLFTGLHGLHIVVGLSGLIYLLVRTREPASGPKYQMTTRVIANGVSVFWHYLDFIWLVLFVLLLTWRG
jgi:cytochrome c oxidase subunit 3